MKQSMTLADILIAIGVVSIWGFNFVVIKIGLQDLPPILFTALRFCFAALPLVFFVKRPNAPWRLVAAYGIFQFALQFTFLFCGIALGLPAGLASLVIQLQAFFTIAMAVLLLGERAQLVQVAGALVALCGMGLVAVHLQGQATLLGFVLVVLGAVCWALANIVTKKIGKVDVFALVVWGSLLAAPPLLLASFAIEGATAWQLAYERFTLKSLLTVLFQSYPNTLLCFALWSMLMRKYAAATVAPFALLVPVAGMGSAALFLGEPLQWWKLAAGLLVLAGLALNQFGARIWAFATAAR
jgi:O-acetylserine/cysteine efflux transporter